MVPLNARRNIPLAALALAALFVLSCQDAEDRPQKGLPTVRLSIGGAEVLAEVARSEKEMSKGLMYRTELKDGRGMLFAYKADDRLSFWMKNTLIPLSIAFISSDGVILDILDMTPHSLAPVNSSRSVRYALEVPQGWFGRAGVKAGDRVLIPSLP